MTEARSAVRWAIVGVHGLYEGQWQRRRDAIQTHTRDLGKTWDECRNKGDRAIKVTITGAALTARRGR